MTVSQCASCSKPLPTDARIWQEGPRHKEQRHQNGIVQMACGHFMHAICGHAHHSTSSRTFRCRICLPPHAGEPDFGDVLERIQTATRCLHLLLRPKLEEGTQNLYVTAFCHRGKVTEYRATFTPGEGFAVPRSDSKQLKRKVSKLRSDLPKLKQVCDSKEGRGVGELAKTIKQLLGMDIYGGVSSVRYDSEGRLSGVTLQALQGGQPYRDQTPVRPARPPEQQMLQDAIQALQNRLSGGENT